MEEIQAKDSNGSVLKTGDLVKIIKDLKVKGSSDTLKQGTIIKNIKVVSNEEVEYKSGKSITVLKACFLKKV